MKIKVCGITRRQDALLAAELGAWAVGFIFYTASKRFITPEQAAIITASLPQHILKIGVFVNQNEEVISTASCAGLNMIQLHGDETPQDCAKLKNTLKLPVIKSFCPSCADDLMLLKPYENSIDYALIDACVAGSYGGTGQKSDWSLAIKIKEMGFPLILSGGLTPENINEAHQKVHPFALDLSSGIESSSGIKSETKLRALFPKD